MPSELPIYAPIDKHDLRGAEALVSLGYPAVVPILPALLEWIKDGNWPVARVLAPFLSKIGAPLAPFARQILSGDDDTWKFFLLETVIGRSVDLRMLLRPELERMLHNPTEGEVAEGLDSIARDLLATGPRS